MIAAPPIIPAWRQTAPAGVSLAQAARSAPPSPSQSSRDNPVLQTIIRPDARSRWMGSTARQFTPERIETVLRSVANGNLVGQWELFDLMEDTWPRLSKNLNELKRAVKSYDRNFEPWAEEEEAATSDAENRAKLASRAMWTMRPRSDENANGFDDTIYDILDAWGKGIAVLEVDYEVRDGGKFGPITAPRCTRWIHPRYYGFPANEDWLGLNVQEINQSRTGVSTVSGSQPSSLNLSPVADGIYARFPENKFLICVCKAKSGHPSVSALLRPLAFWWAASNFTQEWFLNFAQIFGLPIRWATYDPNRPGLLEMVSEMLEDMGSQAWAAFPAGTTLELKEPAKGAGDNPQVSLLDRADKQCDILILGQTLTTDTPASGGGTRAQGEVHKVVRDDIVEAAADFVSNVVNQQIIPAIIQLNFGDQQMLPELCLEPETREDKKAVAETLQVATQIGVKIPAAYAHKRLDIPLPSEGEAVLEPRSSVLDLTTGPSDPFQGRARSPQHASLVHVHAAAGRSGTDAKLAANVLESLTGVEAQWLAGVKPFFVQLINAARDTKMSDAEFVAVLERARDRMPELFTKLDGAAVAGALEAAMGAACVNGAVRGYLKRGTARASRAAVGAPADSTP